MLDMPVMNGCEAVQYIRRSTISTTVPSTTTIYPTTPSPTPPPQRIRQENTTIPVIAVTTNCLDADKRLYTSLGMNCVVSKTDVVKNPNELVRCISQHLPELLQSVVAA